MIIPQASLPRITAQSSAYLLSDMAKTMINTGMHTGRKTINPEDLPSVLKNRLLNGNWTYAGNKGSQATLARVQEPNGSATVLNETALQDINNKSSALHFDVSFHATELLTIADCYQSDFCNSLSFDKSNIKNTLSDLNQITEQLFKTLNIKEFYHSHTQYCNSDITDFTSCEDEEQDQNYDADILLVGMAKDELTYSPKNIAAKFPSEIADDIFSLLVQISKEHMFFTSNFRNTPITHNIECNAEMLDPDNFDTDDKAEYIAARDCITIMNKIAPTEYNDIATLDVQSIITKLKGYLKTIKPTPALEALSVMIRSLEHIKDINQFELMDDTLSCAINMEISENGMNHRHCSIIFTDHYTSTFSDYNEMFENPYHETDIFTPFPIHEPRKTGIYVGAAQAFKSALDTIVNL